MSFTKVADAMARAYERGEIQLKTPEQQMAFSDKLKSVEPRKSGNMGLMSKKPFSKGAEGEVYYGSMRGKGLGVKKVFGESNLFEGKLDTSTVRRRAKLMKSMPEAYPEVYSYSDKARDRFHPNRGSIDMEHIPLKRMKTSDDMFKAYSDVYDAHVSKGFEHTGGSTPGFYDKKKDVFVSDLHPGNVGINARTGKGVVLDPLVYKPLHDKGYIDAYKGAIQEAHNRTGHAPPDYREYTPDRIGARSLIDKTLSTKITSAPAEAMKSEDAGIFGFAKSMAYDEKHRFSSTELKRRGDELRLRKKSIVPINTSDSPSLRLNKRLGNVLINNFNGDISFMARHGMSLGQTPQYVRDAVAFKNKQVSVAQPIASNKSLMQSVQPVASNKSLMQSVQPVASKKGLLQNILGALKKFRK